MLVGEAHYALPGEEHPNFTIDVVRYRGLETRNGFFTRIAKLFLNAPPGKYLSDADRTAFWDSVAFYNFVQSFPGDRPRIRPTEGMWLEGQACFPSVVGELDPELVVALGSDLYPWIPALPTGIALCGLAHPSSFGFRYARWQPIVQAQLARCRRQPAR